MSDDNDDHDHDHDHCDYDTVTARDIAEFLHDYADLRCSARGDDPAERAAFLNRKADLFTRMANKAARGRPASYTDAWIEQVRQMATDARTAANHATRLELLPQQRVGPEPRRTTDRRPAAGGATSQEKSGATPSGSRVERLSLGPVRPSRWGVTAARWLAGSAPDGSPRGCAASCLRGRGSTPPT
jgi:hypothetical protein